MNQTYLHNLLHLPIMKDKTFHHYSYVVLAKYSDNITGGLQDSHKIILVDLFNLRIGSIFVSRFL